MSTRSALDLVLIAVVNTALAIGEPPRSTRLCRPEMLSFKVYLLLWIYNYTALVIYSCVRDDLHSLILVDTPPRSTQSCRPEVLSLQF